MPPACGPTTRLLPICYPCLLLVLPPVPVLPAPALLPVPCQFPCLPACALGLLPVSPTASLSAFTSVYPAGSPAAYMPFPTLLPSPILPQLPRGRQYLWQQCDQRVVGGVASGRIAQFGVGVGVDVDGSWGLDSIRFDSIRFEFPLFVYSL